MDTTVIILLLCWVFLVVLIGLFMAAADFCNDRFHHHDNDRTNENYSEGDN